MLKLDRKIYQKYNLRSKITDEELIKFLKYFYSHDSYGDLELYFKNKNAKENKFPQSLLPIETSYPILGTPYNQKPASILNEFKISVGNSKSFIAKFRDIFTDTIITFKSASQARRWLGGPNMNYWPQQLNFAVWCATSGCGISLNEEYPLRIQELLNFHVYFTVRRILYELEAPLPGDTIFKQTGNHWDRITFQKLCQEFHIDKNSDFRWRGGRNHGLGTVFVNWNNSGFRIPPRASGLENWPNSTPIFHDEHGVGGVNGEIINIGHDSKQYEWFSPSSGQGLTRAGMGRLNRSVEAFVYCIVGAEVNVRSSIIDDGGGGQETQQEMLKLFEDAIIEEDIAQSVQRYQLAIQEAKLRLNFAIAPSIWLMPSNLVINTESVIGYNNNLKKARVDMAPGENDLINGETRQVGLDHNLGGSRIDLPHSISNDERRIKLKTTVSSDTTKVEKDLETDEEEPQKQRGGGEAENDSHRTNIISLIILSGGVGYWLFS